VVRQSFDVVVVGEPLVQLTATTELRDGAPLSLGFSGDALNAAAAAAAAGARTALVARVPDDELGSAMAARIEQLGVDTSHIRRVAGQHGLYLQHTDPSGTRQFLYARSGSAGSQLCPDDLPSAILRNVRIVLATIRTGDPGWLTPRPPLCISRSSRHRVGSSRRRGRRRRVPCSGMQ
jgi:2-dehydro-3-deoxygluconokinase